MSQLGQAPMAAEPPPRAANSRPIPPAEAEAILSSETNQMAQIIRVETFR